MEKTCKLCGKKFSIPDAWGKRGGGIYCSEDCYNTTKSKRVNTTCVVCGKNFSYQRCRPTNVCSWECRKSRDSVTKTCPVCGKNFTVAKSNADRYTVCSVECKTADALYVTCKSCGKVFNTPRDHIRKHCSEECRRPTIKNTCPTCGKEFRVSPSEISIRKFCSPRCYRRYTGETEPEKNCRLCLEKMGIEYIQEHTFTGWKYPVDFYLPDINTVIEVDGVYWHNSTSVKNRDEKKTSWLKSKGYKVIRVEDTLFYGEVTHDMVHLLRGNLGI